MDPGRLRVPLFKEELGWGGIEGNCRRPHVKHMKLFKYVDFQIKTGRDGGTSAGVKGRTTG